MKWSRFCLSIITHHCQEIYGVHSCTHSDENEKEKADKLGRSGAQQSAEGVFLLTDGVAGGGEHRTAHEGSRPRQLKRWNVSDSFQLNYVRKAKRKRGAEEEEEEEGRRKKEEEEGRRRRRRRTHTVALASRIQTSSMGPSCSMEQSVVQGSALR